MKTITQMVGAVDSLSSAVKLWLSGAEGVFDCMGVCQRNRWHESCIRQ